MYRRLFVFVNPFHARHVREYPRRLQERLAFGPTELSAPCSSQLRPAPPSAVRRADPTRPWCVRVLDSTSLYLFPDRPCMKRVPGHALHEEGLQRQIGVGTLVNSQQRRALAVLLLSRLSTAGQPRVNRLPTGRFISPPVYIGFPLFVLSKSRSGQLSTMLLGGYRVGCLLG